MKTLHKKGQLAGLVPAIIALVFAGIILMFGMQILGNVGDNIEDKATNSSWWPKEVNQTTQVYIENYTRVIDIHRCVDISATLYGVAENTSSVALSTAEGRDGCYLQIPTAGDGSDLYLNATSNYSITYSYYGWSEAGNVSDTTQSATGSFGDYWSLTVLGIMVSIIIGLLLMAFGSRKAS